MLWHKNLRQELISLTKNARLEHDSRMFLKVGTLGEFVYLAGLLAKLGYTITLPSRTYDHKELIFCVEPIMLYAKVCEYDSSDSLVSARVDEYPDYHADAASLQYGSENIAHLRGFDLAYNVNKYFYITACRSNAFGDSISYSLYPNPEMDGENDHVCNTNSIDQVSEPVSIDDLYGKE